MGIIVATLVWDHQSLCGVGGGGAPLHGWRGGCGGGGGMRVLLGICKQVFDTWLGCEYPFFSIITIVHSQYTWLKRNTMQGSGTDSGSQYDVKSQYENRVELR